MMFGFDMMNFGSFEFWAYAFAVLLVVTFVLKKWKGISPLKTIYIGVSGVIAIALTCLFFILFLQVFSIPFDPEKLTVVKDSNFGLAFVGTVSGIAALFGGFLVIRKNEELQRQSDAAEEQSEAAKREADATEQGLITDRLNKATEGLGRNDEKGAVVEVRLGALYTLERIAQDSLRDHIQIMEIICSYIRTNSPYIKGKKAPRLREDIQTALTIIGRRGSWTKDEAHLKKEKAQKYRLDLSGCELSGASLNRANLRGTRFLESNLTNVTFDNADLSNAWFEDAILNGTWFGRANTARAWAWQGDFSKCRELTQEQLDVMFCREDVNIPKGLTPPKDWPSKKVFFPEFQEAYWDWEMAQDDSYLR